MRFKTENGGFVTVATKAAAEKIAAQYGMGRVLGPAPDAPKKDAITRPIGVWCDLTQCWDVEPSLDLGTVARDWMLEEQNSSSAPAAKGRDGDPRPLTRIEQAAFDFACRMVE